MALREVGIVTRTATADDRDGVIACARQFEAFPTSDEHVGNLFDLALGCGGMFVALDQGVIGFCCSIILPHPFGGFPYLDVVALFVQPSHRGTWAGAGLVRKLLRFSSTQPLDMVKISAPMGSRLGTLLHRAGFTPAEVTYLKGPAWDSHRS